MTYRVFIRHPGESRDPVSVFQFKIKMDPGLRRDDEQGNP
jgi:hypothetical protein